jgi:DNA-binding HxlR family transcriptional regulator
MATARLRGLWRARILLALSRGPGHFNQLARDCRIPNPCSAATILKKLEREGAVVRHIESIGPPTRTSWHLTAIGMQLVPAAVALIAQAAELRDEREFARSRPKVLAAEYINSGHIDNSGDATK